MDCSIRSHSGPSPDQDFRRRTKSQRSQCSRRVGHRREWSHSGIFVRLCEQRHPSWLAASNQWVGVNLLTELSRPAPYGSLMKSRAGRPGDLIIVSVHWGPNWGYEIPDEQRTSLMRSSTARRFHHPRPFVAHAKAIEVYRNRLILYGCGDFINDYEGISGYEEFRGDLVLMYFAEVEPAGDSLPRLRSFPLQIRNFRACPSVQAGCLLDATDLDGKAGSSGLGISIEP